MTKKTKRWIRPHVVIAPGMNLVSIASRPQAKGEPLDPDQDREAPWSSHIRAVDTALAKKNVTSAMRAWHRAHDAALESQRWEGLVEVGDAALRIGEVAGLRKASEAKARWVYLAALLIARDQASLDGVLRTAEAFAARGEREVVNQCVGVAEGLAARAPGRGARARVREVKERLAALLLIAERRNFDECSTPLPGQASRAPAGLRRRIALVAADPRKRAGSEALPWLPDLELHPFHPGANRPLTPANGGTPHAPGGDA